MSNLECEVCGEDQRDCKGRCSKPCDRCGDRYWAHQEHELLGGGTGCLRCWWQLSHPDEVTCARCDRPATCFGAYGSVRYRNPSCDDCCDHSQEGGDCRLLRAMEGASDYEQTADEARQELAIEGVDHQGFLAKLAHRMDCERCPIPHSICSNPACQMCAGHDAPPK